MKLTRFDNPKQYYQKVENYLLQEEAINCFILATGKSLGDAELDLAKSCYLAVVELEQAIVATLIYIPLQKLTVSLTADLQAVELIARDLVTNTQSLPGITAPKIVDCKSLLNKQHFKGS